MRDIFVAETSLNKDKLHEEETLTVITEELLRAVKDHYQLDWQGTHGVIHWSRVYDIGMKLAEQDGVNSRVLQLFSIFHDSQRQNEGKDPGHGRRGTGLVKQLRHLISLNDDEFHLLVTACNLHTDVIYHDNRTIQACFDTDRLDLGRVNIYPDPELLCTPLAKTDPFIQWAYGKSLIKHLPDHPFGLDLYDIPL